MNAIDWIRGALRWREFERELATTKALKENIESDYCLMGSHLKESHRRYDRTSRELGECKQRLQQFAGYRPSGYTGVQNRLIGDLLKLFPQGFSVTPGGEVYEIIQATSRIGYLRSNQGDEGYLLVRPVDKGVIDVDNPAVVGVVRRGGKVLAVRVDYRQG